MIMIIGHLNPGQVPRLSCEPSELGNLTEERAPHMMYHIILIYEECAPHMIYHIILTYGDNQHELPLSNIATEECRPPLPEAVALDSKLLSVANCKDPDITMVKMIANISCQRVRDYFVVSPGMGSI